MLDVRDFREYFAALHQGLPPFAWQERLLDAVLADGRWPERIVAATGAGKTAVIDVHVFATALMAAGAGPRVPRRLSLVVDRRALVDSQHDLALATNRALRAASTDGSGVVAEVARLLGGMRSSRDDDPDPLLVALLRGGAAPARRWVDDPTAAAVLCATPDMWGSRLLFRGYGTSPLARPREAGLLAYDSVVVVDEAHLARQLVASARRIEALERVAPASVGVGILQVVEATATPPRGPAMRSVGIGPDDIRADGPRAETLARRLQTPKPVSIVPVPEWRAGTAATRRSIARALADASEDLLLTHGRTVACVANTVGIALAAARELGERGREVELLVGRMRPHDLARLRERRPGLLTVAGDPNVDVIVATQTIEVGVDADFAAMVTELAPGSAVVQRAGRVNRLGARPSVAVRVLAPDGAVSPKGSPPYGAVELEEARQWLKRRSAHVEGLAPLAVASDPPPESAQRRTVLGRPEPWDVALLARTSDDLVADPDLALWLADDLEPDLDATLVVRAGLPSDPLDATALLRATPPQAAEGFPVALRTLDLLHDKSPGVRRFCWRGDVIAVLEDSARLLPGDVIVVDDTAPWFTSGVVDPDGTEHAEDALEALRANHPTLLRIGPGCPLDLATGGRASRDLLPDLVRLVAEYPLDGRARRAAEADVIRAFREHDPALGSGPFGALLQSVVRLLGGRLADAEVTFGPSVAGAAPSWVVVADVRRTLGDEEARQTWSAGANVVLLDDHQAGVAARAGELARRAGLDEPFVKALVAAGAVHDEGKRDARFQRLLRAGRGVEDGIPDKAVLAKSGLRTPAELRSAAAASGLPSGWRHEQLSSVAAAEQSDPDSPWGRLAVRLVGTSHGHGRVGFPHVTSALVDTGLGIAAGSERLHDLGAWDALVEATEREHGAWGCAYLEAILRAADGQVSREGG